MRALKKKESEDTKALEDMVQMVESNLATTTKRASSAQNTISKLNEEIKSLKVCACMFINHCPLASKLFQWGYPMVPSSANPIVYQKVLDIPCLCLFPRGNPMGLKGTIQGCRWEALNSPIEHLFTIQLIS